ncbi:uncharacterized protein BX663DRAFT_492013 [Cokeromyces recurvatus]|uniref:uncharacterized protein n=1 Tax=Cokeromyces recurvatus TaxID=90255 RepID=UPI00221F0141|nr:uncharacterized protein BX663DRAFT_492013 [Cokeromyces recurvatus]KAI7907792.1 hypothetical protein BX663DRAFT_492013 [Cokeromyces recurvatus]
MENERHQFELNIKEKYLKEKNQVELEFKLLKESHIEKIQSLSITVNQLSNKILSLENQLKEQNIVENNQELTHEETLMLLISKPEYQQEAQFVKDAYTKINSNQSQYPLIWSNIQNTVKAINHEINHFHAWKSIPIADLTRLLKEDQKQQHHTTMKSLLFGKIKRSQ